ncbi:MAG: peptidylprolyl isomerase [Oscillospiraceae bacterium]|nr:peptidylprolyl isomerase [Oscillospiraceae bacterium]
MRYNTVDYAPKMANKYTNRTMRGIDYMSASDKKKLRKAEKLAAMTEKQLKEKTEAKKLKITTIVFVAILAVMVLVAAVVMSINIVNNTGIIDKSTIAATTGEHKINSVQMNYYYKDVVNNTVSNWKSSYGDSFSLYTQLMGLDVTKPLDEQTYDSENNKTWADYFLDSALEKAKVDYAFYDLAMADNFELSEEQQSELDYNKQMMTLYAQLYGYTSVNDYLKAMYGYGCDLESYQEYTRIATIASAYYNQHEANLEFTDTDIREYEEGKELNYSFFDFAVYYVNAVSYREGGTKGEDGNTTYTDAEIAASIVKAKEIAEELGKSENLVELDKAIKALEINAEKEDAASNQMLDTQYTKISEVYRDWLADEDRKENDITVVEHKTTNTDANNNKIETINGYYVLVYLGRDDSMRHLADVRHLLVAFEGGTKDEDGNTVYSDEEKAKAKEEAEKLLQTWKDGDANVDSFIALVKEHSDDEGSAKNGGLYEDIHKASNYVENFRNWAIDDTRKEGDTGVVESPYGYHIMFYVGDDEMTYRDYLIKQDLINEAMDNWYNGIVEASSITRGDLSRIETSLVLGSN